MHQVWHIFPQKCALFLEYRLVGMRLLHVHQLFDPVLDRTNQTQPKCDLGSRKYGILIRQDFIYTDTTGFYLY